jgi:hypothetical protein
MDGTLKGWIVTGGEINDQGEIISEPTTRWGNPVECRYYAVTANNKGVYIDGVFTQSSYIITTEDMSFNSDRVQLYSSKGGLVCEKEVQSLEVLEDIQRVKIAI